MLDPVHFPQFIAPRLASTIRRLESSIWSHDCNPLTVSATVPGPRIVDNREAKRLTYKPVNKLPHVWGKMFDQRWWKVKLPAAKTGDTPRHLIWDDQAEATAYLDGVPTFGFDPGHMYYQLPGGARELMIESTCCRTGVWVPENTTPMSEHGSVFNGAYLATRDDDAWHAYHDLKVLVDTISLIPLPDYPANNNPGIGFGYRPSIHQAPTIYRKVIRQLSDAIDRFDTSGPAALRKALGKVYRSLAIGKRSHTAILIGHAHVDLVWLWPKQTARFKAVHSFANALNVMDHYNEVHFTYSQPASYQDTQTLSPVLMDRVRAKVRTGKWEATGTMWVESDTQLPCGEALVRSFALGREGFTEINGPRRGPGNVVWLPDTFGYSACIPQIMAGFGIPYFYTTKIHWGSATTFPYTSFRWRGHDGSEVLTHIIQDHYNQSARPGEVQKIAHRHQQADVHDEVLIPTGYGDGGGGPGDAMAERAERISRLGILGEAAGVPDVKWGRIDDFFDRLNTKRDKLPIWSGEMYLQYHRGVQTTHSNLKDNYRAAERALQVWEAVRCATGGGPIDESTWRTLVFCQFHDCLPGTSIWEVCDEAVKDLRDITDYALDRAHRELNRKGGKPCVFNPLGMPNYILKDEGVLRVPALSGVLRSELEPIPSIVPKVSRTMLQNGRISARFDQVGQVRSLVIDDVPVMLEQVGAQLWTFPDHPVNFDAWDIDRPTLSNGKQVTSQAKIFFESRGTLEAAICFTRKIGCSSEATIRYRLDPVRPLILIDMDIDWREPQTLLKLAFPTSYRGHSTRYGSPFGSTTRAQLPGPIETDAMFEVPASRWVALAGDNERNGIALITEAKYGFGCTNGLLHVSLLRSPKITQPSQGAPRRPIKGQHGVMPEFSDIGRHTIRLAIGRYDCEAPREDQPAAWAETLFNPPFAYTGRPVSAGLRNLDAKPGVIPAWAKPISKGCWALRLHETLGQASICRINSEGVLSRFDLNDIDKGRVTRRGFRIKPYQVASLGITRH